MNVTPFQVRDKWVIALNPTMLDPTDSAIGDSSSGPERSRKTAEGFWVEEDKRWLPQHGRAKSFASQEDADAYIEKHTDELYSTPKLY